MNFTYYRKYWLLLFSLSISNNLLAAPSITTASGNILNGETIVISGTGFGVKSNSAPLKWDTFDNGINNTPLKDKDPSWIPYNSDGAIYSNLHSHSGLLSAYNHTDRGEFVTSYTQYPPTDEVYLTYWWNVAGADLGVDYGQIKLSRISSSAAAGGGGVYNEAGSHILSSMNPYYSQRSAELGFSKDDTTYLVLARVGLPYEEWVRIDMYVKLSTPGVSDGTYTAKSYGYDSIVHTALENRASGETFLQDSVLLGLMMANCCEGGDGLGLHIDDVYIDNTRARVELCDKPDFNTSSHCEIQIPTSWSSDNEISVAVNQGSLKIGDTAYIFVIDEDENSSNGYPITIGGSIAPPSPPPGVYVQ